MARLSAQELVLIQQARRAGSRPVGEPETVRNAGLTDLLVQVIVEPIRLAIQRRRTIAELQRLDDRLLADIGLERDMVDQVADGIVAGETATSAQPVGLMASLRCWSEKRATIRELRALDDRMLADIGIERSQIEATVERQTRANAILAAVPATVEDLIAQTRARTGPDRSRQAANSDTPWDHKVTLGQAMPAWWQA